MNTYVFDATGECVCVINERMEYAGKTVVYREEAFSPNLVWYDHAKEAMQFKTEMELVITANTISGIPEGATVTVGSESHIVNDGAFEIEVSLPQVVRVLITHLKHTMQEVEVPCEVQA